ncbi:MAG: hypothetical protein KC503_05060 [Myxococcales bacterium]|nr:hypothetical protein [Myxococcales bacterium]
MSRLEQLEGDAWRDFVGAPVAVLMLGKSDCASCQRWTEELGEALRDEAFWPQVRFGKITLDQRGLTSFKRENGWLADVDALPFNVIYKGGERVKTFPGSGISRLDNRLKNVTGE